VLGSDCWLCGSECELKVHTVSLEIDDRQGLFQSVLGIWHVGLSKFELVAVLILLKLLFIFHFWLFA
jgi:hypothetical protein